MAWAIVLEHRLARQISRSIMPAGETASSRREIWRVGKDIRNASRLRRSKPRSAHLASPADLAGRLLRLRKLPDLAVWRIAPAT